MSIKSKRFLPSSKVEDWVYTNVYYYFESSQNWSVPKTGIYTIYAVGGGGGGGGQAVPGQTGAGGGSGYFSISKTLLNIGETLTINIGSGGAGAGGGGATGDGGVTTVVRSGITLAASPGGYGRPRTTTNNANGGDGGSGGGSAADGAGSGGGIGGFNGSNGQNGTNTVGVGGIGTFNVTYGQGTNVWIPPGGSAGYVGGPNFWFGIKGFGAGIQGASNTSPTCRGGGGGGATWAQTGRPGNSGMVLIEL